MKLKNRMLVLIFFLISIPFLLLSSLFYATSVLRDQRASMEYIMRQSASMIDGALDEVRLLADILCINPVVQEYMRTSSAAQSKNAQIDEMNTLDTVLAHCYQSDAIYDVRMYFAHSKFYTVEQISFFPMSSFQEDRFLSASTLGQISDAYLRSYKDKKEAYVSTYYRLIADTTVLTRIIGALCVDINLSYLEHFLELPRGTGIQDITILQLDGTDLLDHNGDAQSFDMSLISQFSESGYRDGMDAIFAVPLSRNGWVLAGRLPNAYALFGGASNAAFWTALAVLMALVLCFVLAVSSIFARRVDQLVELLDPHNIVPKTVKTAQKHKGFAPMLSHAVIRARELLDYQREQVVLTHKTQLKLLQAQINPHFLYNALDSANWLILDGERERASEMVLAIARYYRFALSKGRDELTIEEDLELATTYARIQECRLKGAIQIQSHIQSAAKGALIPKMTLQPVIENCIIHGFQKQLTDARIDIDVYVADGFLYITVCDNGIGMDSAAVCRIPQQESATGGFGLHSVHQRCILFSADESCGISVESERGVFTMVTIKSALKHTAAG